MSISQLNISSVVASIQIFWVSVSLSCICALLIKHLLKLLRNPFFFQLKKIEVDDINSEILPSQQPQTQ